jgi:hypothetical protein
MPGENRLAFIIALGRTRSKPFEEGIAKDRKDENPKSQKGRQFSSKISAFRLFGISR